MSDSSKPPIQIGFLGLGAMGFGMASHLHKLSSPSSSPLPPNPYTVLAYDIVPAALSRFTSLPGGGGRTASSLANSAENSKIYIVMVASAPQAQSALFGVEDGVVRNLPRGAVLVLCSTVPAGYARSVEKQLKEVGRDDLLFVDAPVSGGAGRAAEGTLSIMAGGSEEAVGAARWVLEIMSDVEHDKLYIVPGGVGKGSEMKMVHQVLAAVNILAVSEAMGFAARIGLDVEKVRDRVVGSKEAWSWMFENRIGRMISEDFYPGASALTIILKDVQIITEVARGERFPTPMCATAENAYLTGLRMGHGSHDDAGMVRLFYEEPLSKQKSDATPEAQSQGEQLVVKLLKGIHLAGVAEAVAFVRHLGLPFEQFDNLVKNAAGGSKMFEQDARSIFNNMGNSKSGSWSGPMDEGSIESTIDGLKGVVDRAALVKCPLYLGTAALNLFEFVALTKNLRKDEAASVAMNWVNTSQPR
ncbi:MAG: hypothetical protein Q9227_001096 [Pyrenula ochraceoflavens]